jgi:hypothetical protein
MVLLYFVLFSVASVVNFDNDDGWIAIEIVICLWIYCMIVLPVG